MLEQIGVVIVVIVVILSYWLLKTMIKIDKIVNEAEENEIKEVDDE